MCPRRHVKVESGLRLMPGAVAPISGMASCRDCQTKNVVFTLKMVVYHVSIKVIKLIVSDVAAGSLGVWIRL